MGKISMLALIFAARGHLLQVSADREDAHDVQTLPALSLKTPAIQPTAQVAMLPAALAASGLYVLRAQVFGQAAFESSTAEISMEIALILLAIWLGRKAFVLSRETGQQPSAAQPSKRASSARPSASSKARTFTLRASPICLLRFGRRVVQRRRLYIHAVSARLEGLVPALCGTPEPLASRLPRSSAPGSHGLHDWHEAAASGFLMPTEVAACRTDPIVCSRLQRLLADRWWALEVPEQLEPIPEDRMCIAGEEPQSSETYTDQHAHGCF